MASCRAIIVADMGQALYRKYRSKSLGELVGQEHVTTTLKNALKQGRISHAYLLSGPRGVGKTSIARILAHEINGLPYDDEAHLDIIEIDAASNRRIDEIRDLRDRVNTAPASAKYKVYIIDEVHMLTKEAFNALLKTLEEPPAHAIFILATTEAHRLPDTIISRTQRYNLRPVPREKVIAHLQVIAKSEGLQVDDEALELISEHGEGSFRDSISLLDQASSIDKHITRAHIEAMLGLASDEYIRQLLQALQTNDPGAIVSMLSELYSMGYEPAMIAMQLSAQLRLQILTGSTIDPQASLELLRKLLDIPASRSPRQLFEITLLQAYPPVSSNKAQPPAAAPHVPARPSTPSTQTAVAQAPKTKAEATQHTDSTPPLPPESEQGRPSAELPAEDDTAAVDNTPALTEASDIGALWQQTLNEIKKQYNTLYGIARMATPTLTGSTLTLSFKFAFHQKRINEVRNRKIFADTVERLYGKPLEIICTVAETTEDSSANIDISTVSNIFGGAELLQ